MLTLDPLKPNDPQLRLLALAMLGGLLALLAGLWWVQVVSARDYQAHLETQSFRTVRIPAARGKILDRNGQVLAENRPSYNISLYLEDLSDLFRKEYKHLRPVKTIPAPFWKAWLGFSSVETQNVKLTGNQEQVLTWQARYCVASNVVQQLAARLQQPVPFDFTNFCRHYETRLALPYPVLAQLDSGQIARFEEQFSGTLGADLEIQSTRVYPHGPTAAHVLGYLLRDDSSAEGEEAFFSYRLPDYRGVVGIEGSFDAELRGRAGAKSVLVNNLGFRQTENIWSTAEPGASVALTLDLRIQQAAENALTRRIGAAARGAVVVMDVQDGDILALVSAPAFDPNKFIPQISQPDYARLTDPITRPQINRATQENYAPGSIFKTVVGLAALEAGLNPKDTIYSPGHIIIGRRYIHDLAAPGEYDFRRALLKSSNTYFISNGVRAGIENIVRIGQRLHLGERAGLPTRQESPGIFPTAKRIKSNWHDGDTANICIGQGELAVTPLQMAVLTAAIANGGKVLFPRIVDRVEAQDPALGDRPVIFPRNPPRDDLGIKPRNLEILREAMLADVEDPEGTGRSAAVPGLRVCGKTGTAQVMDERNRIVGHNLWFISFAPYEQPRYAVVVMVEGGGSGGGTCAPVAHDIYEAIQKIETAGAAKTFALADP
jgi:penicillin-binding protein 2